MKRNIMRGTFLVLLALILGGCGTQRRATQKAERLRGDKQAEQTEKREKSEKPKRVLYPTDYDAGEGAYVEESGEQRDYPLSERGDRGDKKFSHFESANIRVVGINPLPSGGVLELDLDRMRDEFCYPYKGEFLSDYGIRGRAMHTGIDIRTEPNDTIRAAFPGIVRMSRMYSSYGNIVVVQHYYGFETLYGHCSSNLVEVNDVVEAGDPIALGGRTGRATTEHLHFEVRVAGEHVDPTKMIDVERQELQQGMLYVGLLDGKVSAYTSTADAQQSMEKERAAETARLESEKKAAEARVVEVAAQQKAAQAEQEFHSVKSGDTLYGIALRHKTTVKRLCELNNIKENGLLQINQRLRVK